MELGEVMMIDQAEGRPMEEAPIAPQQIEPTCSCLPYDQLYNLLAERKTLAVHIKRLEENRIRALSNPMTPTQYEWACVQALTDIRLYKRDLVQIEREINTLCVQLGQDQWKSSPALREVAVSA